MLLSLAGMALPVQYPLTGAGLPSVGYATSDIRYIWRGNEPIKIDNNVKLPQFVVMGHKTHTQLFTTSTGKLSLPPLCTDRLPRGAAGR